MAKEFERRFSFLTSRPTDDAKPTATGLVDLRLALMDWIIIAVSGVRFAFSSAGVEWSMIKPPAWFLNPTGQVSVAIEDVIRRDASVDEYRSRFQ